MKIKFTKSLIAIVISIIFIVIAGILSSYYYLVSNHLIAHALGETKGIAYTNSLEAFENSHKKGYKFFEVDLTLTEDKKIVCFHGYSKGIYEKFKIKKKTFSYDDFMNGKVLKKSKIKFKTLDLSDLISLIIKHPDTKFMIHVHSKKDPTVTSFILDEVIKEIGKNKEIFNRLYLGVNYLDEYDVIKEKNNFKNIMYYIRIKEKRPEELSNIKDILNYMKERNIKIVSMAYEAIKEDGGYEDLKYLKDNNIFVFSFNQNNVLEILNLIKHGVDVVGTDTILNFSSEGVIKCQK